MPKLQRCLRHVFMTLLILQYALIFEIPSFGIASILVQAQVDTESVESPDATTAEASTKDEPNTVNVNASDAKQEDIDWGTFYDPRGVFCGKNDCYKILGLDYDDKPSRKEITKHFRSQSLIWHPDKNRNKGAKERFVKIKKAHEILVSTKNRKEYDFYRNRPDEYYKKYGSSVIWSYAPQSDARAILFMLFILASLFTYFAQYQQWNKIADHIIKAAVENASTSQGGSMESMTIRKKAMDILAKQEEEKLAAKGSNTSETTVSNRQAKKNAKLMKHDKKAEDLDELKKIVVKLVHEIPDFGAGFHKPTMKDLFVFKLVTLPLKIVWALVWRVKFYARRLRRLPYSSEEVEIMTRNSVGEIGWEAAGDDERKRMVSLELWVPDNLEIWREEQKSKMLSKKEQKQIARAKKYEGKSA